MGCGFGRIRRHWLAGALAGAAMAVPLASSSMPVGMRGAGAVESAGLPFDVPGHDGVGEAGRIALTDVEWSVRSADVLARPGTLALGVDGTGYTAAPFDLANDALPGEEPVWSLDHQERLDVTVLIRSSICEAASRCDRGRGGLHMWIPIDLVGARPDGYLLFRAP
jgi:hypothetical protein